jgi:hypothetical protein
VGNIRNNFSWSITTHRKVTECARAFYYGKYQSWDGWLPRAAKAKRLAYSLKNLQPFYAWRGDVLHQAIAQIWDPTMSESRVLPWMLDKVETEFKNSMRLAMEEVDEGRIPNTKKNRILTEHFYADGRQRFGRASILSDTKIQLEKFYNNFLSCPLVVDIRDMIKGGQASVLMVEELVEHSMTNGKGEVVSVWIKMDLCVQVGDEVWILDWKSGNKTDTDHRQLAIYALYAAEKFNVPRNQVRMFDVYLKHGQEVVELAKVTDESVKDLLNFFEDSVESLRKYLRKGDIKANVPKPIDAFPVARTDQGGICLDCQYRMLCYGDN